MNTHWQAPDGTAFPVSQWGNPSEARAVALFVHGMGGAPSDFEPLGEHLASLGVAGFAPTVRGQGLDPVPSRRGFFFDPAVIASDLSAFAAQIHQAGKPLFLCGESLGALLLAWALANRTPFPETKGLIFSAPVVALSRDTPLAVRYALKVLTRCFPRGRLKPSWFVTGTPEAPQTSRDQDWLQKQRTGPQHIPAFSFGVLDAVGRLMETMPACASRIQAPSLVLAAGCDIFVHCDQVESWFHQIASEQKTFLKYPDSYHVLWNDLGREAVLNDIGQWVGKQH